jgi:hypothetical protein
MKCDWCGQEIKGTYVNSDIMLGEKMHIACCYKAERGDTPPQLDTYSYGLWQLK